MVYYPFVVTAKSRGHGRAQRPNACALSLSGNGCKKSGSRLEGLAVAVVIGKAIPISSIQAHWSLFIKMASQFEMMPMMTPPLRIDGNKIYSSTEWMVLHQGRTSCVLLWNI
eukprot:scaffold188225_cov43-Cyclotella_meneghiniana.AAC.4